MTSSFINTLLMMEKIDDDRVNLKFRNNNTNMDYYKTSFNLIRNKMWKFPLMNLTNKTVIKCDESTLHIIFF